MIVPGPVRARKEKLQKPPVSDARALKQRKGWSKKGQKVVWGHYNTGRKTGGGEERGGGKKLVEKGKESHHDCTRGLHYQIPLIKGSIGRIVTLRMGGGTIL